MKTSLIKNAGMTRQFMCCAGASVCPVILTLLLTLTVAAAVPNDGSVLPFPPTPSGSTAARTMQESTYKPLPQPQRLPENAPNILIVLIDDAGPALPDTYGGDIHTPTLSRVAEEGISRSPPFRYSADEKLKSTKARVDLN